MIIIAKKKRSKPAKIKSMYEYKDRKFIIKDGYGWMKYKKFSSKQSAMNGIKTVKRYFGNTGAKMTTVKTKEGWSVYQLAKAPYRTSGSEIKKHGKRL